MIKSMTGFGRGIGSDDTKKITVEIKSVNHRYLDINVRLPRKCNAFETEIRTFLKSKILRGKVDVYISLEETADTVCNYCVQSQCGCHVSEAPGSDGGRFWIGK